MGRPKVSGIYRSEDGRWLVDKVHRGNRLPRRSFESYGEAESWVLEQLAELKARRPGPVPTFDEAAAHYVSKHEEKLSLELDVYLLKLVVPFIGKLPLDQVDNETLEPFIKAMQAGKKPATRPLKAKTVNLALDRVRRILNLAARSWRDKGKPWLHGLPPLIEMLPAADQRAPQQLAWKEQREHLPKLTPHLARMALFDLQNGVRDEVVCKLRWEWEVRLEQLGFSVFVVPKRYVKGRKQDRVLVCNSIAQSIIESVRGMHPDFVFVYSHPRHKTQRYRPIETMNNTAWQSWRAKCGLQGFRVHDLRHTVGMRLREAGVSESTRADVLWHSHQGMTAHYSVAQVVEIRQALELIIDERNANNISLASIIREAKVPTKVPTEVKRPEAVIASGR